MNIKTTRYTALLELVTLKAYSKKFIKYTYDFNDVINNLYRTFAIDIEIGIFVFHIVLFVVLLIKYSVSMLVTYGFWTDICT